MTRRMLLTLLATVAVLSAGCSTLKKSSKKPNQGLASETESEVLDDRNPPGHPVPGLAA